MNRFQREFRKWLFENRNNLVGSPGDGALCPLACFSRAMSPLPIRAGHASQGKGYIYSNSETKFAILGRWASAFMTEVDKQSEDLDGYAALSCLIAANHEARP